MNWIKMRTDLADDPAVIAIATRLRLDRFGVVGRLHSIWTWATDQLVDGNAVGVTGAFLDQRINTPGFAASMAKVGWLVVSKDGLTFPKWESHLSNGAKKRALTAKRVDLHRAERNASSVTQALPETDREKRREELSVKTGGEAISLRGLSVCLADWRIGEPAATDLIAAGLSESVAVEIWNGCVIAKNRPAAFVAIAKKRLGIHRKQPHIGGAVNGALSIANERLRVQRENNRRAAL